MSNVVSKHNEIIEPSDLLTFKKPYHVRMKEYMIARKRIFNDENKCEEAFAVSPKILKVRARFKERKQIYKSINETVLEKTKDLRPFASIDILGRKMLALLDSGASVSVLGNGANELLQETNSKARAFSASVKTACGSPQSITGRIKIKVKFQNKCKEIDFFVCPSLSQPIYLGIDFFSAFEIGKDLFNLEEVSLLKSQDTEDPERHTLTEEQQLILDKVVIQFPCFTKQGLGKTHLVEHNIDTGNAEPVKQRYWPYSPAMQSLVYSEVDRMLEVDVIEESESPWNSPVILVKKPGKVRLCLDSRKVNALTKKMAYPLPHMEGLLSRLSDTHYISSVDLKDAFWQIPLDAAPKEKTVFTVPGRPHYQFKVMPFGLCNAAQRMCQLMDKAIPSKYRDTIFVYLDDLLIVSPTFESHIEKLEVVAEFLKKANLTINVSKSKFCFKQLRYLGFIVGQGVLKTDPDKISAIQEFPLPKTLKQLRSFLGMSGWYRRFVKNFATLTAPLTDCITTTKFIISEEGKDAFNKIKEVLTTAPVLTEADFSKMFFIQCDASLVGVGSVLFQLDGENNEKPIYFFSKKLSGAQRKYSVTELECLAAVLSVHKFRPFIEGQAFKIFTDHMSLRWLMSQKDLSGRLARWSLKLQAFDFSIEHRKGKDNIVPDCLSRAFCEEIDLNCQLINLDSPEFEEQEYKDLIENIRQNQSSLPDLTIQDDKYVYKRVHFYCGDAEEDSRTWKLWVPASLVPQLILKAHEPPQVSHGGIYKTLMRLRQFFFWPGMSEICKTTKPPNEILRPPMGKQIITQRPFQFVYIDFLGPYPRSKLGNTFAFIVLDQFSKFVFEAYAEFQIYQYYRIHV